MHLKNAFKKDLELCKNTFATVKKSDSKITAQSCLVHGEISTNWLFKRLVALPS